METLNKITDTQITEMCNNLAPINTWLWQWDYDIGESYIEGHEEEISIFDNNDFNLFLKVKLNLKRDNEGYLIDCFTTIVYDSLYDCNSNEVELPDAQLEKLLTAIVDNIN